MLEPRRNGKKRRHPIHKKKSSAQNEEEESGDAAKSRKVTKRPSLPLVEKIQGINRFWANGSILGSELVLF